MAATLYALNLDTGAMKTTTVSYLTTLYRDLSNDTLFAGFSRDAVAINAAALRSSGTWKKRVVTEKYESYGWLAVESDFLDADGTTAVNAVVTVANAAGVTLSTTTVTGRTPVRVTAFREKEIVVTVVSKARITRVTLASTAEELKQL